LSQRLQDGGRRKKAERLLKREKGNMVLKSLELQNVEFKYNLQNASHWPKARLERDEDV